MSKPPSEGFNRKIPTEVDGMPTESGDHLSNIRTDWRMVRKAHEDSLVAANIEPIRSARRILWERYQQAIRKYLLRSVHDTQAAEDLFQEFSLKMLQGALRNAVPERGQFRKYLKTVLANMVRDHYKKVQRGPHLFQQEMPDPAATGSTNPSAEADREFLTDWKDALLKESWERLKREENASGRPYLTALRLYVEHGGEGSTKLAERLSAHVQKPVTAAYFNKQVHNARKQHAFFVVDEVARTLPEGATDQEIEEELIALGLHEFQICKDALRDYRDQLARRRASAGRFDRPDPGN